MTNTSKHEPSRSCTLDFSSSKAKARKAAGFNPLMPFPLHLRLWPVFSPGPFHAEHLYRVLIAATDPLRLGRLADSGSVLIMRGPLLSFAR